MDNHSLQGLNSSPYTKRDSINVRKFFKVHQACNQLKDALKVINDNSFTQAEKIEFANSTNKLENAIAKSPATLIASDILDLNSTVDLQDIFERHSFDGDNSPVHQFINYPVVSDESLENLAFVHKSYPSMNVNLTETQKTLMSNERLEFLGDSWLGALVAFIIYEKYPYANEGALSKMKSAIVNNNNLEKLSTRLGFKERLKSNIPRFSLKVKDTFSKHYADCVEAYIGALVIDRFSVEFKEITDWLEELSQEQFEELNSEMIKTPLNRNAKGELGNLLHFNEIGAKLSYRKTTNIAPFRVEVLLGDEVLAVGTGPNIKEAELRGAMEVLSKPELIKKYSLYKLETNDSPSLVEEIPRRGGSLLGHRTQDNDTPMSTRNPSIGDRYKHNPQVEIESLPEIEHNNVNYEAKDTVTEHMAEDITPERNHNFLYSGSSNKSTHNRTIPPTTDFSNNLNGAQNNDSIDALAQAILSKLGTTLRPMVAEIVTELESSKHTKIINNVTPVEPVAKPNIGFSSLPSYAPNVPPISPNPARNNHMVPNDQSSLNSINPTQDISYDKNASSALLTTLQSLYLNPCYDITALESGGFHCVCSIKGVGIVLSEGTGRSKKIAQHISAGKALQSEALQQVMRDKNLALNASISELLGEKY